jgi:ubiquinone/menaquinone biosynthesis C-methylase UbiE
MAQSPAKFAAQFAAQFAERACAAERLRITGSSQESRMSTANPTTTLSKNYDRAAWFYEASAQLFSGGKIRSSKKYGVAQMQPGQRVAFLGVGTGDEALLAARKGVRVTCIDISAAMLERLQRRLQRENLQAEIICQDAFQHLRPDYYDAVAANYFLNVFREPEMVRMMQHAARLVKPGGKFLIADVALPQGNWLSRAFNWCYLRSAMASFWMLGLVPWHRNYDYTAHFASAGLRTDHVRYFRFLDRGPVVFQTIVGVRQ